MKNLLLFFHSGLNHRVHLIIVDLMLHAKCGLADGRADHMPAPAGAESEFVMPLSAGELIDPNLAVFVFFSKHPPSSKSRFDLDLTGDNNASLLRSEGDHHGIGQVR